MIILVSTEECNYFQAYGRPLDHGIAGRDLQWLHPWSATIAAKKKSINVQTEFDLEKSLTALLSPSVTNANELLREFKLSPSFMSANNYWKFDGSSERIASILNEGALSLSRPKSPIKLYTINDLTPLPPKWLPLSLEEVRSKVVNWSGVLSVKAPSASQISPGVFLLQPA